MNTIEKITIRENKTLKLRNVLIRELKQDELIHMDKVTYMMENYIKSKGNSIIGPMVTYSSSLVDDHGNLTVKSKIMIQLRNKINKVENPYKIEEEVRVTNCLFARYNEFEENLQYAYSKLELYAFEKDINLKGDAYTIFVDNKDNKLVADIFMEVQKEDLSFESL
ncbi:MAG: hypothetical protein KH369_01315 [Paraclostridium bifermentans]|uniref:hypothetical protein n=1 Tax=Paraclostridium bifermentans TaxID=1490 RepID=UPI001D8A7710|nr:hypothetical protein [Paraclostridium bifermentans]MBS6506802.1 hypothetical protein [Paraclostridium bifermentans]MDU3801576.1 hypothetical protein [Paraclostridium bifermentans]